MPTVARWKRRESQAARLLGAERQPSNGRAQPDILSTLGGRQLAVEHKSRETCPVWLTDAVDQAVRNAPAETVPCVVVSAGAGPGRPLRRLVIFRLHDVVNLFGGDAAADGD